MKKKMMTQKGEGLLCGKGSFQDRAKGERGEGEEKDHRPIFEIQKRHPI